MNNLSLQLHVFHFRNQNAICLRVYKCSMEFYKFYNIDFYARLKNELFRSLVWVREWRPQEEYGEVCDDEDDLTWAVSTFSREEWAWRDK